MNRKPVSSSRVSSIGWEDDVLEIEFKSGQIYRYDAVPEARYQELVGASSVGKELNAIIDEFKHERVK